MNAPAPATPVVDEWWYSLSPALSETARAEATRQAEHGYALRFGCVPPTPRLVYVGKTPVLAYPLPRAIEDAEAMQLTLL